MIARWLVCVACVGGCKSTERYQQNQNQHTQPQLRVSQPIPISADPPPPPSAKETGRSVSSTAGSARTAVGGSAGSQVGGARIRRTTAADRGLLDSLVARERDLGHVPVLAVTSNDCSNCSVIEGWFTSAAFGSVTVIEVDGSEFKDELAALHISPTSICFYTLDGGRWIGKDCAMPTGEIKPMVGAVVGEEVLAHVH